MPPWLACGLWHLVCGSACVGLACATSTVGASGNGVSSLACSGCVSFEVAGSLHRGEEDLPGPPDLQQDILEEPLSHA